MDLVNILILGLLAHWAWGLGLFAIAVVWVVLIQTLERAKAWLEELREWQEELDDCLTGICTDALSSADLTEALSSVADRLIEGLCEIEERLERIENRLKR